MPEDQILLTAKQLQTVKDSDGKVNIWEGAVRSGKTVGSIFRWAMFNQAVHDYSGELIMFGRTRDAVWRNVVAPMQDPAIYGPLASCVQGNFGAPTIKIFGRRVNIMGASDIKAEQSLRGMTVLGAYGDEITTIPENFFKQMLARMSTPYSKLFGTTNPDNPSHWLKKGFLDRVPGWGLNVEQEQWLPDWRCFHFNLDDNPALERSYVEGLKREYTGLWYRRFIDGEWVQADGAIYPMWDERFHVVPFNSLPRMARIFGMGIDVGTTNPTRGIILGLGVDGILYAFDEWAPGKGLTNNQYLASLRQWLDARRTIQPPWIYVDPAAASFKQELYAGGILNTANANNDVLEGIRTVASALSTGRLKVSDRCKNLIFEFPGYVWDTKATEEGRDKPVKLNDHALDGLRYVVHTTQSLWRPALKEFDPQ